MLAARWLRCVKRGVSVLIAVVGLAVLQPSASHAVYGMLAHYEVCDAAGQFVSTHSIAVGPDGDIYVADRGGTVRHLSSRGKPLGSISSGPHGSFLLPVVANGPPGVVYVADQSYRPQLLKYQVDSRHFTLARTYATDQGAYSSTFGMRRPVGLVASTQRGLFVLDDVEGIINLNDQDGAFISRTSAGHRSVGIATSNSLLVVANTTDDYKPDSFAVFGGDPLHYTGYAWKTSEFILGVGDGYDGSVWALTNANTGDPGTRGLEHYAITGKLLDTVPIDGGLDALDTTADGSIWVARSDGILRIGPNGGPIPADQYGHSSCGAPVVRHSVPPTQQLNRTHQLLIVGSCNEACELKVSATLRIPSAHTTYRLGAYPRHARAGGQVNLPLGLSRSAIGALYRAVRHHRKAMLNAILTATDGGGTRTTQRFRVTIG
jgi:hypothetical protein